MQTIEISVFNMAKFEEKATRLNKKAIRLGMPEITWKITGDIKESYQNAFLEWITYKVGDKVEITFEDKISLPGGWSLVATLDHRENMVRVVPDMNLPEAYRNRGNICDHCRIDRYRNETFVVISESGEYRQIGRNCLGEFLGIDPTLFLGQTDLVKEFSFGDEEWTGHKERQSVSLDSFLRCTAAIIRVFGWVSGKVAQETQRESTASLVWSFCMNERIEDRFGKKIKIEVLDQDRLLGESTLEWMKQLGNRSNLNDYLFNLSKIAENGFVTSKSAGFAASAIASFQREEEKRQEEKKAQSNGAYLGKVGEKLCVKVKYVCSVGFQNEWGYSLIHTFADEGNNIICWQTQKDETELGLRNSQQDKDGSRVIDIFYHLSGTVKAHKMFGKTPQTNVTRAKVVRV